MRILFMGNTGSGKTVASVDIILDYYKLQWDIYSSHLLQNMDYQKFDSMEIIDMVDNSRPNVVFFDEIGEISTGYYKELFAKFLAQSRKTIGEEQVIIMTSQVKQQATEQIRGLVDYIIYPRILSWHKFNKKPIHIEFTVFEKKEICFKPVFYLLNEKPIRNVYAACDYYRTKDVQQGLKQGLSKHLLEKYKSYIDSNGKLQELTTRLHKQDGYNKSDSNMIAREIIHYNVWKDGDSL